MNRIRRIMKKGKTEVFALCLSILLSCAMIFVGFRFYQHYWQQLITTEESQLQTMAEIIGNNLDTYLNQQLHEINLYYDASERSAESTNFAEVLEDSIPFFLEQNENLYNWISLTAPDGRVRRYAPGKMPATEEKESSFSQKTAQQAQITGKAISSETGWYELYIQKDIRGKDGIYRLKLAMNLETLYQKIVAPVKIGQHGYSSVKDQNFYIIMHNAKDQIGLEARTDRTRLYPTLDYSSMDAWLKKQGEEDRGAALVDTYDWSDPAHPPVRRLVAFQVFYLQGERWIVNSTLPVEELSLPLDSMMRTLMCIIVLYILLLILIMVFVLRTRFQAEAQQKEIAYLKEINHGMETVARQNDEIRHYQRVQSLGMMASHIAHEFNNYLTPVMIYAELLENEEALSDENKEMVHEMLTSVDKASNLSKDLLAFSRQDTGVRLEPLNFTKEVQRAIMIVRQLTPAAITLTTEILEQPLYVLGRKGMAEHILLNLSKNAFQAMEASERKELHITLCAVSDEKLRLEIRDTGCGIRPDALKKIFEPFYTTKGSRQGTGLGLSVVQNIVNSIGGTIRVESELQSGTCFIVEIPLIQEGEGAQGEEQRTRLQRVSRIALVAQAETQKQWRSAAAKTKRTLDFYGHPAALIDRIQKNPDAYELVITEYALPGMNGIELCEIIRRINPKIRLLLVAEQSDADYEWYLNNGIVDRFMLKSEFHTEFSELLKE
ncbi:MAG TPA: hypothetical protein DIW34_08035 [Oribacterium sp.]|nr:hypothetical protein [Oribacterium sp.]